jgi:hypothetical protein
MPIYERQSEADGSTILKRAGDWFSEDFERKIEPTPPTG